MQKEKKKTHTHTQKDGHIASAKIYRVAGRSILPPIDLQWAALATRNHSPPERRAEAGQKPGRSRAEEHGRHPWEWPPKNPGQSPLPPRFCGNQSIAVANCLFPLVFLALGFCFCFCRALVSFPAARWPQMPSPIKMLLSEPISVIF